MTLPRSPDIAALRFRAEALRKIRAYFLQHDVLEVETPILSKGISLDCHIDVFSSGYFPAGYPRREAGAASPGETFYLQTSPEPHMKRLLCRGFPDMFQVTKAFRNGESGRFHNPEFSMLEWYRRDFSLAGLMDEVEAVCRLAAGPFPSIRKSYRDVFRAMIGVDPLDAEAGELAALPILKEKLPTGHVFSGKAEALDFLMAHVVEPSFPADTLLFLHDFPAEQAAQAQVHAGDPRLAHRFEVYGGGMELGNGYLELLDPSEYNIRFDRENSRRRHQSKPELPKDPRLLADLAKGLPPCAGVAMGLDRLCMWGMGGRDIASVLAFPWEAA